MSAAEQLQLRQSQPRDSLRSISRLSCEEDAVFKSHKHNMNHACGLKLTAFTPETRMATVRLRSSSLVIKKKHSVKILNSSSGCNRVHI